jgi:tetratricopeptide (TPR) repeat protein
VTGSSDETWLAIERAEGLPHGRARIALLEELADRAEAAGDAELGTALRVSLIPACLFGGEHQRVLPLLAWLLERYDEAPAWFGPWERHGVLFSFNWATVGLLQHPDVPLVQLEAIVTEMAGRYAAAGESMTPVLRVRFLFAQHVHGPELAQQAFEAWTAAPRSELSECEDCERTEQVRQLAALGRHQAAVDLAMPVLDGGQIAECEAQPVSMIAAVLGSLLETGRGQRAAREHIRGVRLIRDRRDAGVPGHSGRADHLLVSARSGRLQRGLELLEEWLPWFATSAPPSARLEALASAVRLLHGLAEAGYSDLAVGTAAESITVAELGARLSQESDQLGARFDARNGTSAVGDLMKSLRDAPPLRDLPLEAISRSPQVARVRRPPTDRRRGRRSAGRDTPAVIAVDDLNALAEAFDEALKADSRTRCRAVLDAWRGARNRPIGADGAQAAARLDGWLAIEVASRADLAEPGLQSAPLTPTPPTNPTTEQASEQLRAVGLPVEALLHEQVCLLTGAQAGRIDPGAALARIDRLAIQVGEIGLPADAGLALSRLVLMREMAAAAGSDTEPAELQRSDLASTDLPSTEPVGPEPAGIELAGDPLDVALATLGAVPQSDLDHHRLRAISQLLRIRAADEPPEVAIESLSSAVAVLPNGVRPLERAMAGADLAGALSDTDPAAALTAWEQAIADATAAAAAPVLGNLLAASATLRHSLGDPARAAADLAAAIPLLDEHSPGPLATQARFDLSRALLDLGRPFEAAEVAEAGLADLTDLLLGEGVSAADEGHEGLPEAHLAGCCAFAAAEANAAVGATDRARELAERSAQWHRFNGNLIAQAEAWELASGLGGPPAQVAADLGRAADLAEAGGDWGRAATCRRERTTAVKDAEGVDAAFAALDDADAALGARVENPAGRHIVNEDQELAQRQLRWHRLAVTEQRARLLAVSGRFEEAMVQVEGLEEEYRGLGDAWSARDLKGLRGQLRAELDDLEGALDDLRLAAEEAAEAGDQAQAYGLGERLAAVLEEAGRPDDAEQVWLRFCKELRLV